MKIYFHKESKVAIDFTLIKLAEKIYKVNNLNKCGLCKALFFFNKTPIFTTTLLAHADLKKDIFLILTPDKALLA